MSYRVFKRSCRNWEEFARANKRTQERGLTYEQAQQCCARLNAELTRAQARRGTKYEFEQE